MVNAEERPADRVLAREIAELRALDLPALVARYVALYGRSPRSRHRAWLWKRIAWKLEERRLGGLSKVARDRLEALIAEIDLPLEERAPEPQAPERLPSDPLRPGAVLTRRWRDQEIRVLVREGGFEWNGTPYCSLSAVALAVTGARWNGRLFFGLSKRKPTR